MIKPDRGASDLPDNEDDQQPHGSIESVGDSPPDDVEDTADGGAIVKVKDAPVEPDSKFYDNLVPLLDAATLNKIQQELDERIREDKKSREQRDKDYQEGIQRTGLGKEAPGGATFVGASKVVHPMLSKAAIDFEARAIAELMPPAGAVKEYIPNDMKITQLQVDKARRVANHMNWQLLIQMPEFRPELEQCLSQVPLGGSQFMYLNWDERRGRPTATYWPSDDVQIPYGSSSVLMAERVTQVERITQRVYEQRIDSDYYAKPVDSPVAMTPDQTGPAKAAERVEGVKPDTFNQDGLREIWRVYTELELDKDKQTKGKLAPYVIEMNADQTGIKRIVRNWEEKDKLREAMQWLVEFPFLPWRGALSIGLAHVIGSLSGAATGALRALLDSAHVQNFPAVLKLKGANFSGQTKQLEFGSFTEIEGGVGINDDIRKLIMAIPYNPTSPVLMELLGLLSEEGESVVATTLKNLSEAAATGLPVGTTLAIIEQGMKVYAGVHQRLLHAMTQLLRVLYRINKLYVTDDAIKNEAGTLLATRQDYTGPMDVIPVADPNIFSDAQRYAQMQVVADRAVQHPDLYDQRKVEEMILERSRIPDAKNLLAPSPVPEEMHSVNENAAMAMGRAVAAFPEQDHLAHIQVHMDFAMSPALGQLSAIAPKFLTQITDHIGQHVALWYVASMYHAGSAAVGKPLEKYMGTKNAEADAELDRLMAKISPKAAEAAGQHFGQLAQELQQLSQMAQQYKPQPQQDNSAQVANINAQAKAASDQARAQTVAQQLQAQQAQTAAKIQSSEKVVQISKAADLQRQQMAGQQQMQHAAVSAQAEAQRTAMQAAQALREQAAQALATQQLQQQKDAAAGDRATQDNEVKTAINEADNQTATTIAAAELAGGHRSSVSTGTGINP